MNRFSNNACTFSRQNSLADALGKNWLGNQNNPSSDSTYAIYDSAYVTSDSAYVTSDSAYITPDEAFASWWSNQKNIKENIEQTCSKFDLKERNHFNRGQLFQFTSRSRTSNTSPNLMQLM